jgi:hypothetical protein
VLQPGCVDKLHHGPLNHVKTASARNLAALSMHCRHCDCLFYNWCRWLEVLATAAEPKRHQRKRSTPCNSSVATPAIRTRQSWEQESSGLQKSCGLPKLMSRSQTGHSTHTCSSTRTSLCILKLFEIYTPAWRQKGNRQ